MNSGRNTFLVLWFFFYSGARYSAYLLTYNTQLLTCICVLLLKNGHGLVLVFGSDFGVKNLSQKSKISSSIFTELREFRAIFCCRPEAKYIKSLQL